MSWMLQIFGRGYELALVSHQQMHERAQKDHTNEKIHPIFRHQQAEGPEDSQRPDRVFKMTTISPNLVKLFLIFLW